VYQWISSRLVMKIMSASETLSLAWNGKIDKPVENSRPLNWLIRRVRVERLSRRGRVRSECGESLRP
jgi:hypothetical protein